MLIHAGVLALVDEAVVDLVTQDVEPVPVRQLGDEVQVLAGQDPPVGFWGLLR